MSDILSSISILVAILTALQAIFYPQIQSFLDLEPDRAKLNNAANFIIGKSIRRTRVLPLSIGSICLTLVFIPELIIQLTNAFTVFSDNEYLPDFEQYDTVAAAYIMVVLFCVSLTCWILVTAITFNKHLSRFNPN